ncbi:hypothetical protein NDU88_003722 [Pleurodeles waltl]|uniref:Uncharacterized protein n=1 Tax=Pleurodeles waltl TaxID=8319 RepID=A0AAV7UDG8_PLEWA|nr:hypothetical protein NDU88_003722 [Pleurodeles waltl]
MCLSPRQRPPHAQPIRAQATGDQPAVSRGSTTVPSRSPPRGSRRSRQPAGPGWVTGYRCDRGPPSSAAPGTPEGPAPVEQLLPGRRAAPTSAPAARPPGRGSPRSPAPSGLPRDLPVKRRALKAQGRSRPEAPGNRLTSRGRWCCHRGPPAPPRRSMGRRPREDDHRLGLWS